MLGSSWNYPRVPHGVLRVNPPLTFTTLQPACSAFSPEIRLPPHFKQYSKGFEIAILTAKLNVPTFNTSNFRIWQPFNLSKISDVEKIQLKKLEPTPTIPMKQLRVQISSFRHIETKSDQSWIYYVWGGSGSGLLLLLVIGGLVYWCCKRPRVWFGQTTSICDLYCSWETKHDADQRGCPWTWQIFSSRLKDCWIPETSGSQTHGKWVMICSRPLPQHS